jgi:hypothetical protein
MSTTFAEAQLALEKKIVADAAVIVQKDKAIQESQTVQTPVAKTPWWSTHDAMTISASVLVFGALLIAATTFAIVRGINASTVLRVYGLLTIIVMAVFLVVAGYDATQIGPVVGLLGTLAGYFVGRTTTTPADSTNHPTEGKTKAV